MRITLEDGGYRSRLISEIHDSIIISVPENEIEDIKKLAQKIMVDDLPERFPWLSVPFEIDVELTKPGESWAAKK